jgi:acylphosphatase
MARGTLYAARAPMENRAMAKRLKISGRAQGVGFRYEMAKQADRLGVTGWVRNCRDGSVEAVVDGPPDKVEAIIAWARRGPPSARVTGIDVSEAQGSYGTFEQRPTE